MSYAAAWNSRVTGEIVSRFPRKNQGEGIKVHLEYRRRQAKCLSTRIEGPATGISDEELQISDQTTARTSNDHERRHALQLTGA